MKKFIVDGQYGQLLKQNNIDVTKVLKVAKLPENLFANESVRMSENEYYSLMNAIDSQNTDETILQLSIFEGIEKFSPPIFAAFCSENGLKCIERLSQYKKLLGPVLYDISTENDELTVSFKSINNAAISSKFYVISEFIFLINLLSKATEQEIKPIKITSTFDSISKVFIDKLYVSPIKSDKNSIAFSKKSLNIPFLTDNKIMREYLTPELNSRLSELDSDNSFSSEVRTILVDILPTGLSSIEDVAVKLNISKRTLQRKLKDEKTNFQQQINNVREMLAKSYLKTTNMSSDEIAYLLGYLEVNSFLRAFMIWTGISVSEYRKKVFDGTI